MATTVHLLCCGATAGARAGRFPHSADALDAGGRAKVAALRLPARMRAGPIVASPATAARETAALLGLDAASEPRLAETDHGAWAGRAIDALDPVAVAAWLAAPDRAPPAGEGADAVTARVAEWLAAVRPAGEIVLAVTHGSVVRAAIGVALGIDIWATRAIDVAPLAIATLSCHDRWRLQELRRA